MTARYQATREGMMKGYIKIVDTWNGNSTVKSGLTNMKAAKEIAENMGDSDLGISGSSK